jgi:thermitase
MLKRSKSMLSLATLGALLLAGCGQVNAPASLHTRVSAAAADDEVPAGAEPEVTVTLTQAPQVEDQLIVAVQPGMRVTLAATDPQPIKQFDMGYHFQVVKIPAGMSRDEAIKRLQARPGVKAVAPNRAYAVSMTPNDPMFSQEWGMQANRINAGAAWDKQLDASKVTVAILDTGVDYNHPELAGRVILGPDVADKDTDPMDVHGHGTHVAGIIGAAGNNGQGIAGVAWNCKIMAIKVLGNKGAGTTDNVLEGIKYAADHGARVINMSLGTSDPSIDPVLHMGLEYAYKKGCVIVAAAGNEHGQVGSPANDPHAIAVSSTSSLWMFEWLSTFSNHGEKVEVAAPGGGIWSLFPSKNGKLGTMYGKLSGTSMACPYVAGEAALILSQHPNWTADQVRARIDQAVDDKGAKGRDQKYGFGRINLKKALD